MARKLPIPRPGAMAAKLRYLASTYEPRYQLWSGADPWSDANSVNSDGALSPTEVMMLGLALKPIQVPE
jgi:hypothetical protein